jgi:hypothetical protein
MAEKYGLPGNTDPEGFDPYIDTVGPGIYGGSVKRDEQGTSLLGHNIKTITIDRDQSLTGWATVS